jgi:hypothetical protein
VYNDETPAVLQDPGASNQHRKTLDMTDDSIPHGFVVYADYKATTGEIFYVGKANPARYYVKRRDNNRWRNTVAKHGFVRKILYNGLQEWAAFELEIDTIALYGRADKKCGPLVNTSDGGEGSSGYKHTPEALAKIGQASKQFIRTAAWRANIGAKHKGKTITLRAKQTQRAKVVAIAGKPVTCLTTGAKFDSLRAAATWCVNQGATPEIKTAHVAIRAAARCVGKTAYGYEWAIDGEPPTKKILTKEERNQRSREGKRKWVASGGAEKIAAIVRARCSKQIKCIETGQIFPSAGHAAEWAAVQCGRTASSRTRVCAVARGDAKSAYGYKWEYVSVPPV